MHHRQGWLGRSVETSDVAPAITAATSVAASLGLLATGAVVLHNSNTLVLRLTPCDVLARATIGDRGVAHLELERARQLSRAGCRVGLPEPRVDPKVYACNDFAVTLWVYYEPVTARLSPADYAWALQSLHSDMRNVDMPSPQFTDRMADAAQVVAEPDLSPELSEPDRALLGKRLARSRDAIDNFGADQQLLHGEPTQATSSPPHTAHCSSTSRPSAGGPSSSTSRTCPSRSASSTHTSTSICWTTAGNSSSRWSPRGVGGSATSSPTEGNGDRSSSPRCAQAPLGQHSTR